MITRIPFFPKKMTIENWNQFFWKCQELWKEGKKVAKLERSYCIFFSKFIIFLILHIIKELVNVVYKLIWIKVFIIIIISYIIDC
jgi:hypothetical protein